MWNASVPNETGNRMAVHIPDPEGDTGGNGRGSVHRWWSDSVRRATTGRYGYQMGQMNTVVLIGAARPNS